MRTKAPRNEGTALTRMNARLLIWMNRISYFCSWRAALSKLHKSCDTPSRFGTVPGFDGASLLSHHICHVPSTLALSQAYWSQATTWAVFRCGYDRGNRGRQCAKALFISWREPLVICGHHIFAVDVLSFT